MVFLRDWRQSRALPSDGIDTKDNFFDSAEVIYRSGFGNENSLEEMLDSILMTVDPLEEKIIRTAIGYGNGFDTGELVGRERWIQRITAKKIGISQPQVSRLYAKGIRKLRHPSRARHIRKYFDEYLNDLSPEAPTRAQNLMEWIFGEKHPTK